MLVDLLKLAAANRVFEGAKETISSVLVALGTTNQAIGTMLLELCVTELEDTAANWNYINKIPQSVVQESQHPYIDATTLVGHVRLQGAEALRIEFDKRCSTEKRHDPLTIMDGTGRIVAIKSGRDPEEWAIEIRIEGLQITVIFSLL